MTKIAVREARLKEIKQEMLNSARLRAHFADNPRDAAALRHDRALHTVKHQPHLKGVPDYIVPQALKRASVKSRRKRIREQAEKGRTSQAKRKFERRKADPLKNIKK